MSNWWGFGETAAQDNYEELPPPTTRITVRPQRPIEWPQDAPTEEERRIAEYVTALQPPPKREAPPPIQPSVYDTQQFMLRPPKAIEVPLNRPQQAEARSIEPTLRERGAQTMMGESPSTTRARLVRTLMGTTGVGETGLGAVDFVPFLGSALGSQEEAAKGDYQMAAVNAMPGGKPARKATGALKKVVAEALTPSKIPERNVGFAPGSVLDPATAPVAPLPPGSLAAPYVMNPVRVANPGVYKRPDVIAREAAANVVPEHPALKALFGVTRDDLYQISQQGRRQGNVTEPNIWMPNKPGKPNEAALAVMNEPNARRLVDTLAEARKYEGLEKGMVPWYVMDPLYQRMERLVGPERAAKEYHDFNMSMTPFSAGSSVPMEINRGTAANMMRVQGQYPTFQQWGGLADYKRGPDFPEELRGVKGMMGHGGQAKAVARYMATGKHGYGTDSVKINLYSGASGVPETGFQTRWAVPDAHYTRALGVPDARTFKDYDNFMGGTEYRQIGPWYREAVAEPLGIEAVPAQALQWGTYGLETGVKTKIGAGKLELISQAIWDRAAKLGIDPKKLRDDVLEGKAHAIWLLGALVPAGMMGGLAAQDNYDDKL
jgi:hypothetical protein